MEATESILVENDVARLRLQFVEDLGVPRVSDEDSARSTIRGSDCLTNTILQMANPNGSIGRTKVRKIRAKRHLQIDDRYPRAARSHQSPRRRWNDCPNLRNAHSKSIQQAALGSEVVLHINDDDRGPCRIDRNRFWLCINHDNSALWSHWVADCPLR